jgi:hypothetical protein
MQMDVWGYNKELKLRWYPEFKDWYNTTYPIQIEFKYEEKKHTDDDFMHDIREGLSFTSSFMS